MFMDCRVNTKRIEMFVLSREVRTTSNVYMCTYKEDSIFSKGKRIGMQILCEENKDQKGIWVGREVE
jgi:hypothetical protein